MRSILNGYVDTFYVLGNKEGNGFINHTSSKVFVTDPMRTRKFEDLKSALDFKEKNKNNYDQEIFPHQIRITVELI
jgi:hypothetical protein